MIFLTQNYRGPLNTSDGGLTVQTDIPQTRGHDDNPLVMVAPISCLARDGISGSLVLDDETWLP